MNKSDYNIRIFYWVWLAVIAIIVIAMSSCSSIKKLKSNVKQSSKVDSTSQQITKVDSSGTNTITKVDSSGFNVEVEFEKGTDTGDVDLEITVHKPSAADYYKPAKVSIKSNKAVKKININDTRKQSEASANTANVKRNDEKKTNVKKEEQKTVKQVEKKKIRFQWWWWLLLLLIPVGVYVLYKKYPVPFRNMFSQIKKITGMKSILLIALSAFLFIGCIAPDKDKTKVEERESLMRTEKAPNGAIVYNQLDWETILVDTTGDYHVKGFNEKGQGAYLVVKDTTWQKSKVIPRSVFHLTMPKKMVKHFMVASDYFTESFLWATILSLLVAAGIYIFLRKDLVRLAGKGAVGIYVVVLIAVPFRMYQKRPSELAMQNVKQLSRSELEEWTKKDPTFETFWKEKWANNELEGLTNKAVVE